MNAQLKAYCGTCQERRPIEDAKEIEIDGKPYVTGRCPVCSTRLDIEGHLPKDEE